MIILGREGLLNTLLLSLNIVSIPLRILYTDVAVELGLTELFLPFMYLSISSALENIPEEYVMAAPSLGAGSFRAFVDIVFPLSITGFITGPARGVRCEFKEDMLETECVISSAASFAETERLLGLEKHQLFRDPCSLLKVKGCAAELVTLMYTTHQVTGGSFRTPSIYRGTPITT
ncbi:MAG: ABC transporter permease subunit [Desulfurococcaceae archaeon]